jgi:MtN3 and saliva related transmembrane protein
MMSLSTIHYGEYLGFVAGFLTTVAFIAQIIKTFKNKSTKDISLAMYLIFSVGVILWIIYGIMTQSYSIIATNVITLLLAIINIIMKLKWK